jgi:hypothetical protein
MGFCTARNALRPATLVNVLSRPSSIDVPGCGVVPFPFPLALPQGSLIEALEAIFDAPRIPVRHIDLGHAPYGSKESVTVRRYLEDSPIGTAFD